MRSTRWAILGLLVAASMAVLPAQSVGGLTVHGVGTGVSWYPGNVSPCAGHPVTVDIFYMPNRAAFLSYQHAGAAACPLRTGGVVTIGQLNVDGSQSPPVRFTFSCAGTEASGLYCSNAGVTIAVGPYNGPGGSMWLSQRGGNPYMDAVFTVV
jgi:hypothetical protein